jgi:glycolate oxidase
MSAMNAPDPVFATDLDTLIRRLRLFLPAHCLLVGEEDLRPYECDGLTAYRELPLAVCLPETEAQVIDILRTCHSLGVPVVARGWHGLVRWCDAARPGCGFVAGAFQQDFAC